MDEVDGRPGHVALPTGHLDALKDAPKPSLCLPFLKAHRSNSVALNSLVGDHFVAPMIAWGQMNRLSAEQKQGAIHENVPGK
jgi:hypothetical protein